MNYSEDHGILLPGRIPGYNRMDLKLLPSSTTKLSIWELYRQCIAGEGRRIAGYRTFRNIWKKYLPQIIITKPMSDLCWTCQQNNTLVSRSSNKTEAEKSRVRVNKIFIDNLVTITYQTLKMAEQHLTAVMKERSYFRAAVDFSKKEVRKFFNLRDISPPAPHSCIAPHSNDLTVHYSFDFAQQVHNKIISSLSVTHSFPFKQIHIPSDPMQPGPIYFLTPRKCAIFGVCCEAIPRQINYLIDEAVDVGKGANTVVSLLHHFFQTHGLGEHHVHLHADNCVGQNKNNTMLQVQK